MHKSTHLSASGMMKISVFALLATVCVAVKGSKAEPSLRINCQECIGEMHSLGRLIKEGAPAIEVRSNQQTFMLTLANFDQLIQSTKYPFQTLIIMILRNHSNKSN